MTVAIEEMFSFLSSGLRQPMRLPCKAKWRLWTSSQVQTIHSKTKDGCFHAHCQLCCVAYGCCAVCTGLCAKYCYSHQPIYKVNPRVCPQSVISYCAALEMTRWDSLTSGRTPSRLPSGLAVALWCPVSYHKNKPWHNTQEQVEWWAIIGNGIFSWYCTHTVKQHYCGSPIVQDQSWLYLHTVPLFSGLATLLIFFSLLICSASGFHVSVDWTRASFR